jgi:hypothetical protein
MSSTGSPDVDRSSTIGTAVLLLSWLVTSVSFYAFLWQFVEISVEQFRFWLILSTPPVALASAAGIYKIVAPLVSVRSPVRAVIVGTGLLLVVGPVLLGVVLPTNSGFVAALVVVVPLLTLIFGTVVYRSQRRNLNVKLPSLGVYWLSLLAVLYLPFHLWLWVFYFEWAADGYILLSDTVLGFTVIGHMVLLVLWTVVSLRNAIGFYLDRKQSGASRESVEESYHSWQHTALLLLLWPATSLLYLYSVNASGPYGALDFDQGQWLLFSAVLLLSIITASSAIHLLFCGLWRDRPDGGRSLVAIGVSAGGGVTVTAVGATALDVISLELYRIVVLAVMGVPVLILALGSAVHYFQRRSASANPPPFGVYYLALLAIAYAPFQRWLWYAVRDHLVLFEFELGQIAGATWLGHVILLGICGLVAGRRVGSYLWSSRQEPTSEQTVGDTADSLADLSGVDRATADALAAAGFETRADVEGADTGDLTAVEGVTRPLATHIVQTVEEREVDPDDVDVATDDGAGQAEAAETGASPGDDAGPSGADEDGDDASEPDETTGTDAVEFTENCGGMATLEPLDTEGHVHVYAGRLADGTDAHVYALAPEHADDTAVCEAFERAVDQWHGIEHNPHIAGIHATGEEPRPWVAFDAGETRLSDADPTELGEDERLKLLREVAEGLRTGGLYNLTHGALRPEAVSIATDDDGHPAAVVADWGVTTSVRDVLDDQTVTPYTAPEQVEAPGTASRATDVYRLGAVAQYVLTGEPPIDLDRSDWETLPGAVEDGDVVAVSEVADLSDDLDDILATAMAADPADRYASSYEFRDDLTGVLG